MRSNHTHGPNRKTRGCDLCSKQPFRHSGILSSFNVEVPKQQFVPRTLPLAKNRNYLRASTLETPAGMTLHDMSKARADSPEAYEPPIGAMELLNGGCKDVNTHLPSFNIVNSERRLHGGDLSAFTARLDHVLVEEATGDLETYDEFNRAAERLALMCNFEEWRNNEVPEVCEYDVKQLKRRLFHVQRARYSGNPERMLRLIRTELSRFVSEIDRETLFHLSLRGTKVLIEEYIDSVCSLLVEFAALCHLYGNDLDRRRLAGLLEETRLSFGRTALMCSGGGK